jgi:putative transposase
VGVTDSPTDAWVARQLRQSTPFGQAPKYLIRDNDSKFGTRFSAVATGIGIRQLKIPVRAPDANAVIEHFIGSFRRECLDHILVLSTDYLHRVLNAYVTYFNTLRPHQSLQQHIPAQPDSPSAPDLSSTTMRARPILGGLHHAYEKVA